MHSKEEIFNIVARQLGAVSQTGPEITPDTNLAERFALDSVKVLDLVMEIEDEFDISVPMNLMADVQTVTDLVDVIHQVESSQ
jgi:acyl carrier protein